MIRQKAVFLDRDGTLVYPYHYPSKPEQLRLYEDLGPALAALQASGWLLIIITNQSGIAHGYFTESDLSCMHKHLQQELATWNVHIDAIYYCPHHPEGCIPDLAHACTCRKPQPGMLIRAARELDIDLSSSWFVGDILDDVEAGNRAGCQTILVDLGTEQAPESIVRTPHFVATNTLHALRIIPYVLHEGLKLTYRPDSWQCSTSDIDRVMEVEPCSH